MIIFLIVFFFLAFQTKSQTFSVRSNDLSSIYTSVYAEPFGYQVLGRAIDSINGELEIPMLIRNFSFDGAVLETKEIYIEGRIYIPPRDNNARLNDTTMVTVVVEQFVDSEINYSTVLWLNNAGDTLLSKRFSSPYYVSSNSQTNLNLPTTIICSPDGQYIYFVSQIFHSSSQNNFMIKKLTAQGEEVWTYVNPLGNGVGCNAIVYSNEQIWFVLVSTSNRIIGLNDSTGEVETNQLISPLSLDYINVGDFFLEEDNFIAATLDVSTPGDLIPIIYKFSNTGEEVFQTSPDGADFAFSQQNDHLVKSPDGGYVSCSVKYDEQINPNAPNDPAANNTSEKIWLWKVDSEGNFLWQRFYEYIGFDSGYFYLNNTANDLKATPDGGYIMAGEARANCLEWPCLAGSDFTQQGWLLKVDGCGCLVPGCDEQCVVGVNEQEGEKPSYFKFGPNPARESLNLYTTQQARSANNLRLQLHDMSGKQLQSVSLHQWDTTYIMDIDFLPAGEYILSLSDGNELLQTERLSVVK